MMPALASCQIAQQLHECNARLDSWLDGLVPEETTACPQPRPATPHQMSGLLSELMRAGGWLRSLPSERDPELQQELMVYRKNVERLRDVMPSIHAALLRERARLEQDRGRVESAAAWARSSRQTL